MFRVFTVKMEKITPRFLQVDSTGWKDVLQFVGGSSSSIVQAGPKKSQIYWTATT